MDNMKQYVKFYMQKREECFKKWGYYYPPKDWAEFEEWNKQTFQKHLKEYDENDDLVKKTKVYVSLLGKIKTFGLLVAFQSEDYRMLNNVLYQASREQLLGRSMTASGTDHANVLMNAASAFACNDFDIIKNFFPKELPLSKGIYYTEVSVNLLKVLYYKDNSLLDESIKKAEKFLNKKVTLWEKYAVSYFISLINRDVEQVNLCLQELCLAYQKLGENDKLDKCFSSEVHGLYRFARIIDEDFFKKIECPNHPCFFKEFEEWQVEHGYPQGEIFYAYTSELEYMNKIFNAPLPTLTLKESEDKKEVYKNVEKFAADLTGNINSILTRVG